MNVIDKSCRRQIITKSIIKGTMLLTCAGPPSRVQDHRSGLWQGLLTKNDLQSASGATDQNTIDLLEKQDLALSSERRASDIQSSSSMPNKANFYIAVHWEFIRVSMEFCFYFSFFFWIYPHICPEWVVILAKFRVPEDYIYSISSTDIGYVLAVKHTVLRCPWPSRVCCIWYVFPFCLPFPRAMASPQINWTYTAPCATNHVCIMYFLFSLPFPHTLAYSQTYWTSYSPVLLTHYN